MTSSPAKTTTFFFYGEDSYTVVKKIAAWQKKFEQKYGSQTVTRIDIESWQASEDELLGICKQSILSQSLFHSDSLTIIENLFSSKTYRERVGSFFSEHIPKLNTTSFLVFVERKIDKRLSLYKSFCEFEKRGLIKNEEFLIPHGIALSQWIQVEATRLNTSFTEDALAHMCAKLDPQHTSYSQKTDAPTYDLWLISNELHKLASYAFGRAITSQDIALLCPMRGQVHIFDCIASFIKHDTRATLQNIHSLIAQSGAPDTSVILGICSFFQNQLHDMLIIKDMSERRCTDQQIADLLDWKKTERVRIVARQVKQNTLAFLKKSVFAFSDLERVLKSRPIEPQSLLLHTLARILTQ